MNDDLNEEDLYMKKHEGKKLKTGKVNCLAQRCHDMNCCMMCCKRRKQYKLFEKGRDLFEKEIDIAHFL